MRKPWTCHGQVIHKFRLLNHEQVIYKMWTSLDQFINKSWISHEQFINKSDLEKVVNFPKAVNSKIYNVLKIAWFMTKDDQNYVYGKLVWQDRILKSWLFLSNSKLSILNFKFSLLHSPSSYLKSPSTNLNSTSSTVLPPSLVKSTGYLTQNVLNIPGFWTKFPQAPLALLAAFSRSETSQEQVMNKSRLLSHEQAMNKSSQEQFTKKSWTTQELVVNKSCTNWYC